MHIAPGVKAVEPRFRTGDAVRIRGERWTVLRQTRHSDATLLEVRGADAHNANAAAGFLLPFESVSALISPSTPRPVSRAEWRLIARQWLASATPQIDSLRTPARARIDVLPFQLEPAIAFNIGLGCRALIADEVGLGKTIQAGLVVAEVMARTADVHVLVVCPAALRIQWQAELHQRFGIETRILDAAGIGRIGSTVDGTANPWAISPVIVTSVDFVKRPEVMRALEGMVWDVLVLDEAHNLASRSERAAAADALAQRARHVVMLSATPHSGDADAFNRLCAIGDRQGRFPLLLFRRTRTDAGMPVQRHMHWLRVQPSPGERDMHHAMLAYARRAWLDSTGNQAGARLAISILLRRAASSAVSLERSIERRLALLRSEGPLSITQLALPFDMAAVDDDEPLAALAFPALKNSDEEERYLERILSLARLASGDESKVRAVHRLLGRTREPLLIFTEYRDTLVRLRQSLDLRTRRPLIAELHGGMARAERADAERSFTAGAVEVLLATDAASEGLNLHHRCRCVISLEAPWNPVRLEQRIGRVDRIGQQRRVHAIQLVAAGTADFDVARRLRQRAARAADALTQPVTELDVADAVMTGADIAEPSSAPAGTFVRPDLRDRATAEAAHIDVSRRISAPAVLLPPRPVIATSRRKPLRQVILALELVLSDDAGVPVWSMLVGLGGPFARQIFGSVETAVPAIAWEQHAQVLAGISDHVVSRARTTLEPLLQVAATRERAIVTLVRQRHARIAADLLQAGLFDHRTERRAAAQTAVLEEALGRCNARLDTLARLAGLAAEAPALRFAIVLP
ncbi:MAG TPA: helicase-related protein [Vicinamibacterales bacterium]|nr:helicase-related protein [Vicinamibacterales bacterium]